MKTKKIIYYCKLCNRAMKDNSRDICQSCLQVQLKGKSPKPSKEKMIQLLNEGIKLEEIARIYERSVGTVGYWIKQYNLVGYRKRKVHTEVNVPEEII